MAEQEQQDVIHELEQELDEMGVHVPTSGEPKAAAQMPPPKAAPVPAPAPAISLIPPASNPKPSTPVVPALVPVPAPTHAIEIEKEPAGSTLPPVPMPQNPNMPKHNEVMGQVLTHAIQEGKDQVPAFPDPLVSKPGELQSWRVFKIMSEFVEGFELLRKYGLAATFFGSARQTFDAHYYADATALAGKLAKAGFAVITGGSTGIMAAANKGAYDAGGASIGLNIRLQDDQGMNKYLTDSLTFEHFFVRKVMLTFASEVYVYFPGGFGTLDEFTEIVTLVQTHKIRRIPIVLFGKEYWEPFTKLFEERLLEEYKAIDAADLQLYAVVDTVDEAFDHIMNSTGGKDIR